MKQKIGKKLIRFTDGLLDIGIIGAILLMLCYGGYVLWDADQIEQAAAAEKFQIYHPESGLTGDSESSFERLREKNPEVIGWITIPDTQIDYPFVQAENNSKYLRTDVNGEFALAGSIFLDYRNAADFSDVNSVIYGHHVQDEAMFGDLRLFEDEDFFQTHREADVYFDGQWHTLELFSFCEVDAYEKTIYEIRRLPEQQADYLKSLEQISLYFRKLEIQKGEHFVSLSTCITGKGMEGRYVLTGRLLNRSVMEQGT